MYVNLHTKAANTYVRTYVHMYECMHACTVQFKCNVALTRELL